MSPRTSFAEHAIQIIIIEAEPALRDDAGSDCLPKGLQELEMDSAFASFGSFTTAFRGLRADPRRSNIDISTVNKIIY